MKVLHLLSSLKYDESERGIYAITHAMAKAGHKSVVIGCADKNHELVTRLLRDDTIYYQMAMPKKSWWALRHIFRLKHLILQHKPDIIHVHSRTPAWVLHMSMSWLPKEKRPKVIATVYGFYPLNSYTKALFFADIIISASRSIDRYLKENLAAKQEESSDGFADKLTKKIICVRRGVDVKKYPYRHHSSVHWLQNVFAQHPELEYKKWLVFPTPIGSEYGQDWLIDILGNLQEKFPKIHAVIMDDDLATANELDLAQEEFVQKLYALDLQKRVTFVGKRPPDMREWLASADIVLALANYPESIGITAIQAVHLGTPVIGWSKGAFADILTITYPQGLVKEETAFALCKSVKFHLQNPIRPAITHEYTIEEMVKNTLNIYQNLINPDTKKIKTLK